MQDMQGIQDMRDMFREYLDSLALGRIEEYEAELSSLTSLREWEPLRAKLMKAYLDALGEFPVKTPLNPRTTGEIDKRDYSIRKVIFESLPGLMVTSNLYVPKFGNPPFPGVLVPCGHSENGKAARHYQEFCISLVRRGYAVLIYDPISQGERVQYRSQEALELTKGMCTFEHCLLGNQFILLGGNIAAYMIWDSVRAIDYLCSLPEVDPERVAVSGCSGGGTNTAYVAPLDKRIKAAAPICYITSRRRLMETIGAQDAEQNLANSIAAGLDHAALCALAAPMPYLIGAAKADAFPIDGTHHSFELAQRVYSLYGARGRISLLEVEGGHGISQEMRLGVGEWLDKWLKPSRSSDVEKFDEGVLEVEPDENLLCTKTGDVHAIGSRKTIYFFRQKVEEYAARVTEDRRRDPSSHLDALRSFVSLLTGQRRKAAGWRTLGIQAAGDLYVERVHIYPEEGVVVPGIALGPKNGGAGRLPAVISVRPDGKEKDIESPIVKSLVREGFRVFSIDPRGVGETAIRRKRRGYPESPVELYGDVAIAAYDAMMLGRPVLGMRAFDVLGAVDYLIEREDVDSGRIGCIGIGMGALWVLIAGACDERISGVIGVDFPASYASIATNELYMYSVDGFAPGILRVGDISDIAALIAPRPLLLANPLDHMGRAMDIEGFRKAFSFVAEVYERTGDAGKLDLAVLEGSELESTLLQWGRR